MIIKIIAGVLLILAILLIVRGMMDKYKEKIVSYTEASKFVDYVQSKINVYNVEMDSLVEEYKKNNNNQTTRRLVGENIEGDELASLLRSYMSEISKSDREYQRAISEYYVEKIKELKNNAEKKEGRRIELIKKVFPWLGIGIFILVL